MNEGVRVGLGQLGHEKPGWGPALQSHMPPSCAAAASEGARANLGERSEIKPTGQQPCRFFPFCTGRSQVGFMKRWDVAEYAVKLFANIWRSVQGFSRTYGMCKA